MTCESLHFQFTWCGGRECRYRCMWWCGYEKKERKKKKRVMHWLWMILMMHLLWKEYVCFKGWGFSLFCIRWWDWRFLISVLVWFVGGCGSEMVDTGLVMDDGEGDDLTIKLHANIISLKICYCTTVFWKIYCRQQQYQQIGSTYPTDLLLKTTQLDSSWVLHC